MFFMKLLEVLQPQRTLTEMDEKKTTNYSVSGKKIDPIRFPMRCRSTFVLSLAISHPLSNPQNITPSDLPPSFIASELEARINTTKESN